MHTVICWFRNDLRLADNAVFTRACGIATQMLPVYCHAPDANVVTQWGFVRMDAPRQHWRRSTVADLSRHLRALGSDLAELHGRPQDVLAIAARAVGATTIVCELIAAPEEEAEVEGLRAAGFTVEPIWQSSMLAPAELPFAPEQLPAVFTAFREAVERARILPAVPLPIPAKIPPLPELSLLTPEILKAPLLPPLRTDTRSSFPYHTTEFSGGAAAANAHLAQYFARKLAHSYKATRNGLSGADYSSKFSPWLATGALSARTAYAALKRFEAEYGANEGSYWLWFELLWRDYFRLLHLKHGRKLYAASGLSSLPKRAHDAGRFLKWCNAMTGEPLVDAAMRELAATGYLSNRLRQIVAGYLLHELCGDWRAGAAWFEAQLIDYDVYSNQGNWLYIAGRGSDPRGGRRFNLHKQASLYDADGRYRALWNQPVVLSCLPEGRHIES